VPFVRTVDGDIDPTSLGVTYSHEHLVIDGGRPVEMFPDFRLDDVALVAADLAPAVTRARGVPEAPSPSSTHRLGRGDSETPSVSSRGRFGPRSSALVSASCGASG